MRFKLAIDFENIMESIKNEEVLQPMVNDDCGGVCQGSQDWTSANASGCDSMHMHFNDVSTWRGEKNALGWCFDWSSSKI